MDKNNNKRNPWIKNKIAAILAGFAVSDILFFFMVGHGCVPESFDFLGSILWLSFWFVSIQTAGVFLFILPRKFWLTYVIVPLCVVFYVLTFVASSPVHKEICRNRYTTVDKPIIYLYPEKETQYDVRLSEADDMTVSYPPYNNKWHVTAKPDGTLIDGNNKEYYGLYYELGGVQVNRTSEGFCVKGDKTASFLDEKLTILGLNAKERNEFIIYWLPKLCANKYNYIRFLSNSEIDDISKLSVKPDVSSKIRVYMIYEPLDSPIDAKEQKLKTPGRNGDVLVEWGGIEIKKGGEVCE